LLFGSLKVSAVTRKIIAIAVLACHYGQHSRGHTFADLQSPALANS
jgi:hypothetical protein